MMTPAELIAFAEPFLRDAAHSWSIGTFGAIGEFHRDPDEACDVEVAPTAATVVTERGGIRIKPTEDLSIIAYDTLSSDGETWAHGVAICAPRADAATGQIVDLGEDAAAIREGDRRAWLFDIGVGLGGVRMCVRTAEPELVSALSTYVGQSLLSGAAAHALMPAFLKHQPHRVMLSPAGRVEVYSPIPLPGGESPLGPHTHLLPKLLASRKTHSSNTPIPDGLQPVLSLHPCSPWRDSAGKRKPYEPDTAAAFDAVLAAYGLSEDRIVRGAVEAAVAEAMEPTQFEWPASRRGRTQARITLRRMSVECQTPLLSEWRSHFDRAPVENDDPTA